MDIQEKTLHIMAKAEEYNKWMYEVYKPYIGEIILEVGCGTGNITKFLEDAPSVIAIDIREDNINELKRAIGCRENLQAMKMDVMSSEFMELKEKRPDTILCISMLEHVENDMEVLKRFNNVLLQEGSLLLFLPAMNFLYGSLDIELGHFRRYEKKDLLPKIKDSGFRVLKMFYFNLIGVPGWFLNSRILRKKIMPEGQMGIFNRIVPFLKWIEGMFSPPLGSGIVCIAKKVKDTKI